MITFESVTKRFPGGTVAVDDLTLHIAEDPDAVAEGWLTEHGFLD